MIEEDITKNIKINENIEILKKIFPSCFDKNGNFNIEKFQEEINKDGINFSKESYGLDWLGKSYARALTFEPSRTLLKENEEWNKKEENINSENLLLKGDNLEVLKHLSNAYYEKVKMIYIDPPYNTGNGDFVYQDDRKFTIKELIELTGVSEEKAKRILDFINSNSNSHSAWLTFMYPRLYIARKLLKDDGAIFVSIDDNEMAQLRILMDEIFGEENFVANFIWNTKKAAQGMNTKNLIVPNHEYILVFAKNSDKFKFLGLERDTKGFSNPDNDYRGLWKRQYLQRLGQGLPLRTIIDPKTNKKYSFETPYTQEKLDNWIKEDVIIFPKVENGYPARKEFYNEYKQNQQLITSLGLFATKSTTEKLYELFDNKKIFTNPKPDTLIKFLLKSTLKKSDMVLDFFAGSGTTGDALMQLNAEDGGNRKYILVQIPEVIDEKKKRNKIAYKFVKNELKIETPTIFDITKERLIRVGKRIIENNNLKIGNFDAGFKIFETLPLWKDYLLNEKKLTNQTQLFEVNRLNNEDLKALFITWKTYDGLALTEKYQEIKLNDYISYYTGNNLYLMYDNWQTKNIKSLLEKIDSDENFVVDKIIIFGYNFESIALREIEENIKNYSNKKQIEIEIIIRF
jgi:adenine-specific DNA-methyltransferase